MKETQYTLEEERKEEVLDQKDKSHWSMNQVFSIIPYPINMIATVDTSSTMPHTTPSEDSSTIDERPTTEDDNSAEIFHVYGGCETLHEEDRDGKRKRIIDSI